MSVRVSVSGYEERSKGVGIFFGLQGFGGFGRQGLKASGFAGLRFFGV